MRRSVIVIILLVLGISARGNVRLKVDSTSLDFGHVSLGGFRSLQFNAVNTSTSIITIDGIQITGSNSGDFKVNSPANFSVVLTAGSDVQVIVDFKPLAAGTRTAALRIETSDGVIEIPITGSSGSISSFQFSVTQLDFGKLAPGMYRDTVIKLYSTGSDSATISGMQVSESDTSFHACR